MERNEDNMPSRLSPTFLPREAVHWALPKAQLLLLIHFEMYDNRLYGFSLC